MQNPEPKKRTTPSKSSPRKPRNISVRAVRLENPDLDRFARAVLEIALLEAEKAARIEQNDKLDWPKLPN